MLKCIAKLFKNYKSQSGYSLTELSISTSIIAMLAVGGLAVMQKKNESDRVKETLEKVETIKKAINGFVRVKKYIPCPGTPTLLESNTNFGVAVAYDTTNFNCTGLTYNVGMVPVRTLNLNDDYAYDGWGRKFTFRTAKYSGIKDDFDDITFNGDIIIVDINSNPKTDKKFPNDDNDGATYVIVSHGGNGKNVAYRKNDTTVPGQATGYERTNTEHSTAIYLQDSRTSKFDDIVDFGIKANFIKPKVIIAPIAIDRTTCENAKALFLDNEEATRLSTSRPLDDFVAQNSDDYPDYVKRIYDAAKKLSTLCDHPPVAYRNPSQIANLQLWLDANDSASVYSNSTCTTLAGADSSVSCWKDKSGNNNHVKSSTGYEPKYRHLVLNNNPVISFESNDYLKTSSNPAVLNVVDNFTIMAVAKTDDVTTHAKQGLFTKTSASSKQFALSFYNASSGITKFEHKTYSLASGSSSIASDQFYFVEAIVPTGGANSSLYLDGSNVQTYSAGASFSVGFDINIGRWGGSNNNYLYGDIAETMFYDRAISTKERGEIGTYILDKWGITLSGATANLCEAGKTFRKTASHPEGSCLCPDGEIEYNVIKSSSACFSDTTAALGGCVAAPSASVPNYGSLYGFSPSMKNNLVLWLDANDCSTITLGTSNVTKWADKSPKENHATQSVISSTPLYNPNSLNAKPVISFDGGDNLNIDDNSSTDLTKNFSIFVVGQVNTAGAGATGAKQSFLTKMTSGSLGQYGISFEKTATDGKMLFNYNSQSFADTAGSMKTGRYYLLSATVKGGGTPKIKLNKDGIEKVHTNASGNASASSDKLEIGRWGGSVSSHNLNGNIAEVIMYDRDVGQSERYDIEKYISEKWDIFIDPKKAGSITDNLQLWLDASENANAPKSSCSGVNAENNSSVACWKDKSGNSRDVAQSTEANRPSYKQWALNNKPALYFDGSDDHLTGSATMDDLIDVDQYTVFTVFGIADNAGVVSPHYNNRSILTDGTNGNFTMMVCNSSGNKLCLHNLSSTTSNYAFSPAASALVLNNFYIASATHSQGKINVRLNGTAGTDVISSTTDTPLTGSIQIGKPKATSNYYKGYISEVIVYDTDMPNVTRLQDIESYLSDKWAITLD